MHNLKIKYIKQLAAEVKYSKWDQVTFNFIIRAIRDMISTREIYPLITGNTLLQVI